MTDADGSWSFTLGDFGRGALYQTLSLLAGFAFGLVLMSSAPAIVLAYLLPTAFAIVSEVVPGFRHTADWLDTSPSTTALLDGDMTSELWQQLPTSELLWIALPLAIGLVRLRRRELAEDSRPCSRPLGALKRTSLCVPSQNGRRRDLPQRQSATVSRPGSIALPSWSRIRKSPRTSSGPSRWG